jgi:hypothetical protein
MNRVPRTRVTRAFRRTALPLASYYAVTIVVPLANGAARSGAFVEHALAVLVVPPVAIILTCAVYTIVHALASACRRISCSCWVAWAEPSGITTATRLPSGARSQSVPPTAAIQTRGSAVGRECGAWWLA